MLVCVDDQCFTLWLPNMTAPPEVDLRVLGHPAQSASVYTSVDETDCFLNSYTSLGAVLKDRHTRFKAPQACAVGLAIHLHTALHANCASTRSAER